MEELKSLPWSAVWDYYCLQEGRAHRMAWFDEVRRYEEQVLSKR
jgi:L-rhamnose isomerase